MEILCSDIKIIILVLKEDIKWHVNVVRVAKRWRVEQDMW